MEIPPMKISAGTLDASANIKPRVLIMIAAEEISGPGKGVLQLLETAPIESFEYVLCNFELTDRPVGKFVN